MRRWKILTLISMLTLLAAFFNDDAVRTLSPTSTPTSTNTPTQSPTITPSPTATETPTLLGLAISTFSLKKKHHVEFLALLYILILFW